MKSQFRSFNSTKKFAQLLKIRGQKDWQEFRKSNKRPSDIPANPPRTYKDEWAGWGDWFGTGTKSTHDVQFKSFTQARKFVHTLKISGRKEWVEFRKSNKRPSDIPSIPERIYKDEWAGWGDWFGTGSISHVELSNETLPWNIAKPLYQKIKIENNLKNHDDWNNYVKKHKLPKGLPKNPNRSYSKQTVSKKQKERKLRYNQKLNS